MGEIFRFLHQIWERKHQDLSNFTSLRQVCRRKNHLAREITRNKCGNCEEMSGELPATCKEKGAKIFQSIEK